MYGLKMNRLEKSREEWYRAHHQTPPNLGRKSQPSRKLNIHVDTHTYTKTSVFKPYSPPLPTDGVGLSYWEGKGAGIEPIEFSKTLQILRESTCMSPSHVRPAPIGRINECFTPYQNDIMAFDAFETARKELKFRAEHIASEMRRVDDEWNRPPAANWFMLKDKSFTPEHSRFLEQSRRKRRSESARRQQRTKNNDDPRRSKKLSYSAF
ncbi:hypothetical protein TRFO_08769 [Tritrichomonas foetus]|uniref:Uncharacterized protein n=1 Tax=Tritrichomonas foetus TaxID=1144522 RepID=A0A1J4JHW9_9EUKA|nr:hypothetical protein TRFO_08769 [Tritrichomonas foetus]|eukprot:OHS98754.1 hypothetical protein TRFO_08769 [Tritrichomonas foetus]